jgi:hypothetical protein
MSKVCKYVWSSQDEQELQLFRGLLRDVGFDSNRIHANKHDELQFYKDSFLSCSIPDIISGVVKNKFQEVMGKLSNEDRIRLMEKFSQDREEFIDKVKESAPTISPIDAVKRLERAGTEHSKTNQKLIDAARRYAAHVFDIVESLGIPDEYHCLGKQEESTYSKVVRSIGFQRADGCFVIPLKGNFEITLTHYVPNENGMCCGEGMESGDGKRHYMSNDGFEYHESEYMMGTNFLKHNISPEWAIKLAKEVANGLLDELVEKIELTVEHRNADKKRYLEILEKLPNIGN